jgi:frataxin-like iron-binding protein CyaY
MKIKYFLVLGISVLLSNIIFAQIPAIGEWRTHMPYDMVIDVAIADNIVFAATPYNLFTYNTEDNRVDRFDKVKGLNSVGVTKIGYNSFQNELLISYADANLDVVDADENVINISDIKDKDILGNKTINNIVFKDELAYLSCGFGIVVLDMAKREIHDTYYIGAEGSAVNVLDLTYNDSFFYAATTNGIYYADVNADNLADFNQWTKDETMIHPDLPYNLIQNFQGKIYTNYYSQLFNHDTLFVYDGTNWDYFAKENVSEHHQMNVYKDKFLLVNRYSTYVYDKDMNREYVISKPSDKSLECFAAEMDKDANIWIGDKFKGLVKTWGNGKNGELIKPNGPRTKSVFAMDAFGPAVWVASGGHQSDWGKTYNIDGVFSFIDNEWTSHYKKNTPALDTISDMVCAKVDPAQPEIAYIGTWQGGLLKFENNELTQVFDESNSSLQPWVAAPNLTNVSGIDFDDQHNLWVANTGANDVLSVLKNDGSWKSFNLGGAMSAVDIGELIVDKFNQKWMIKRKDGYIAVFTDNNTIDDISDDRIKILSAATGSGAIPGNKVYSFAVDQDGEVWVGTDEGVCVFYSPSKIFQTGENFDASQILVPRNDGTGLADILLVTETVTAITVDGANQKWIGTDRAGVFLLSPDGLKEIYHFTTENSPLLSNNITDIAINENGEVFIGTANGIISYKSSATPENPKGLSNVYAYPNPVRENFTGLIGIKGLVNNASIKITDSYGNLVYESRSEGGQAVWDGKDFNGRRAATGVYLVFVTNSDGTEKVATKILFIN